MKHMIVHINHYASDTHVMDFPTRTPTAHQSPDDAWARTQARPRASGGAAAFCAKPAESQLFEPDLRLERAPGLPDI